LSQTIEITVDSKGEVTVQTKGFTGSGCKAASQFIEKALGTVTGEQLTAEYHQTQSENQPLKQGR
jgi:Protein of unknown function (DUF2997)